MSRAARDYRDLSVAERIQLVEDIWDSIAVEGSEAVALTDAQREELRRRLQAHDADPEGVIPWEQVRAELDALLLGDADYAGVTGDEAWARRLLPALKCANRGEPADELFADAAAALKSEIGRASCRERV